ncbi:hypothetical protein MPCS_01347 [Candidatus Megaera polyxenophila]|nr:hypothetical protein MPCS_01347 [Candidatus Megaera polyxenophila]
MPSSAPRYLTELLSTNKSSYTLAKHSLGEFDPKGLIDPSIPNINAK